MRLRPVPAWIGLCASLALACASSTLELAPGRSGLTGSVRLVPHEGVDPGGGGGGYGDRRLRDVRLVDYDKPGFTVVYVEGGETNASSQGVSRLEIRESATGLFFEPGHAAVRVGGPVTITNHTDRQQIVSLPGAATVRKLAPGATTRIELIAPGPHRVFLLEDTRAESIVFAAPGPFSVTSSRGDFEMTGLEPGPARVHVWHPRFPPAEADVVLKPDATRRVVIEVGVGRESEAAPPASPAPLLGDDEETLW